MADEITAEIEQLLQEKQYYALRSLLSDMNEADIASIFSEMREDSLAVLFRLLPKYLFNFIVRKTVY